MFKRIASALVLLTFLAVISVAAPAPAATGKVVSIDGKKVQVTLTGEAPDWAKKGAGIKIKGLGGGKILEVSGTTLTLQSPKASTLQVGQEITFEKGPILQGC
jgi:hypothetical protein